MNIKRMMSASIAVFVVFAALGYLIHSVLLSDMYQQTAAIWRPFNEMMALWPIRVIWEAWFSIFFVLIFIKGYEFSKGGVGQGARYGMLMGLLLGPTNALVNYFILPMPAILAAYWGVADIAVMFTCGLTAGLVYRS